MAWLQSGKLYSKELPGGGSCGFGVGHAVNGLGVTYYLHGHGPGDSPSSKALIYIGLKNYPPRMPAGSLGFLAIGLRVEGYCGPRFVIQVLVMP